MSTFIRKRRITKCKCGIKIIIANFTLLRSLKGLGKNNVFRLDYAKCKCGHLLVLKDTFGIKSLNTLK